MSKSTTTRWTLALLAATLAAALGGSAQAARTLDEGRLDVAWFDAAAQFRETDEIDYLWVRPGFSLDGRKLRFVAWAEPAFTGEDADDRDAKDRDLARAMNGDMPRTFADAFSRAFGSRLSTSTTEGDLRVEGRIVDCSTGSTAAKIIVGLGAGSGNVTLDLRFVDAASGQVMAGLHQRVVSGTTWSTTDSKFAKWVDKMARELAARGIEAAYQKGDRVRK
ncbi:MAG: DUF4410 domain-containing protein [Thermoanaerobaculia bacterium]